MNGLNPEELRSAPKRRSGIWDRIILLAGCVIFVGILLLPEPGVTMVYVTVLEGASATLKGHFAATDINQDIIGARGLLLNQDPYPSYSPADLSLGYEEFAVGHASTHPPTAFLFTLPIARMPQRWATAIWAWLMLALLTLTIRCYGASWSVALGLTPIALLWTPLQISLGQVTIVWLFGVAVAYRFQATRPFVSGASIALASLTKFLPGLLVIACFMKRQWRALAGFVVIWVSVLAFLMVVFPGTIERYLEVNQITSLETINRLDNAALLFSSYRLGSWPGAGLAMLFLLAILATNRRCLIDSQPASTAQLWRVLTYFSVTLLPIAWIYSIVPLLPIVVYQIRQRKFLIKLTGLCCLILPCVAPIWGSLAVSPLLAVMIAMGAGLIFDALPFRIFTAVSLADLMHTSANQ